MSGLSGPVDGPRLVDAVTLRHFGAIDRMSLIEAALDGYPEPRWTETVRSEILAGIGRPECDAVLEAGFLGTPYQPDMQELLEITYLQGALQGLTLHPGDLLRDLGEAESIHVADKLNGSFVTDDAVAFEFARKKFGSNRVLDTVHLLRELVSGGHLAPSEAQQVADAIRNLGRHLRSGHPATLTAEYFEP